jgi:hypothetical protein
MASTISALCVKCETPEKPTTAQKRTVVTQNPMSLGAIFDAIILSLDVELDVNWDVESELYDRTTMADIEMSAP